MKTLLFILALLTSSFAQDVNVTLTWDQNTEADLAGYRVYWGTATREYVNQAAVVTNRATIAVPRAQFAYIVVTAVNTGEKESGFSHEFVYFATTPGEIRIPSPPQNIKAPKELNSARIEKSTDLKTWVPIYWSSNPAEFFRLTITL